jgi:hypothetical protein
MIRLSPAAQVFHAVQLQSAELFVLCHELGHFLNGDLEEPGHFKPFDGHESVQEYEENQDHEREYGADATGFRLLMAAQGSSGPAAIRLLQPIISLFNLFYLLGSRSSATHPHPLERSIRITERFFGRERAETLRRSYDDPGQLVALFRQ